MITEVVLFKLKEDSSFGNSETHASRHVSEKLVPRVESWGAKTLFFGFGADAPSKGIMIVDWNSLEDHERELASTDLPTTQKLFAEFADVSQPITVLHVPYEPRPSSGAFMERNASSMVQCTFLRFPRSFSEKDRDMVHAKLSPNMKHSSLSLASLTRGWAVEGMYTPEDTEENSCVFSLMAGFTETPSHLSEQTFIEEVRQILQFQDIVCSDHTRYCLQEARLTGVRTK